MEERGWQGEKQCLQVVRWVRHKGQGSVPVPFCNNRDNEKKDWNMRSIPCKPDAFWLPEPWKNGVGFQVRMHICKRQASA